MAKLTGTAAADKLIGTDANDELYGLDSGDELTGGDGDDLLDGGAGSDFMLGGPGNDTLLGREGDDLLRDPFGNNVFEGGAGNDTLESSGNGTNRLDGGIGNDTLSGGNGNDTLVGGEGNDTIWVGNATSDGKNVVTVDAGAGDDRIGNSGYGKVQNVTVTGGSGINIFQIYGQQRGGIVITDFKAGAAGDKLELGGLYGLYQVKENPFGTLGKLRLQQSGADTLLQYDEDGAAGTGHGWVTMATLKGVSASSLVTENFKEGYNPSGGSSGPVITGTFNDDVLAGTLLDDTIDGRDGNDRLIGGLGKDKLLGGYGDDTLDGGDEGDTLDGGPGKDKLTGGAGDDLLNGDADDDWIYADAGKDVTDGGAGNDLLQAYGGDGHILNGGDGNDRLTVTAMLNATLNGGAGDDEFDVNFARSDAAQAATVTVNGGAGADRVNYHGAGGGPVDLQVTGGADIDTHHVIAAMGKSIFTVLDFAAGDGGDKIDFMDSQELYQYRFFRSDNPFAANGPVKLVQRGVDAVLQYGTLDAAGQRDYKDMLVLKGVQVSALTAANFVGNYDPRALARPATVNGTAGDDKLAGGELADDIKALAGNDTVEGGSGDDTLYGGDGHDHLIGGAGYDKLYGEAGNDQLDDAVDGAEMDGGDGDDVITNAGDAKSVLRGGNGNDKLYGGAGADQLHGESGDDLLLGGAGDDLLTSGLGNDRLEGGDGNDDISAWSGGSKVLLGGAGNDKISNRYGGKSTIDGGDGDDVIEGQNRDTVDGGAGADVIYVYGANDVNTDGIIHGGSGNDHIAVSTWNEGGRVVAWGDEGRDTFILNGWEQWGQADYLIADFAAGAGGDLLDVQALVNSRGLAGLNPFSSGGIRVQQSGADTLLTFTGSAPREFMLVRLLNLRASDLGAENILGGYAPDGSNRGGITLAGTAGADSLQGFAMHDRLEGGAGDDILDGGSGTDVAVYNGKRANFTVAGDSVTKIVVDNAGTLGHDTLRNIERLQFNDTTVALDVDGAAGKVYRLYQAAYDRKPDAGGLGFWVGQADKGVTQASIAEGFIGSAEFKTLYGAAPSNDALVSRIYTNVLHRDPDASGKAFWVDVLDRKAATVAEVLMGFSESPENVAAVAKVIGIGFEYQPWQG